MKFSDEQKEAIKAMNNALVSAGAGSGKTAVLTERVRRNIAGEGENGVKVSLNELLILTFTKDAASSMKAKIKTALSKDDKLKHLVPFVDSAHIDTFDAYAQFVVSKYGYKEHYPSNITVISEDILKVRCATYIDQILEELYASKDKDISDCYFDYLCKNDNSLLEFLRKIYFDVISKQKNQIEFLENYKKEILTKEFFVNVTKLLDERIVSLINRYEELTDAIVTYEVKNALQAHLSLLKNVKTFEDLKSLEDELYSAENSGSNALNTIIKKALKECGSYLDFDGDSKLVSEAKSVYKKFRRYISLDKNKFLEVDVPKQIRYINAFIDKLFIPLIKKVEAFKFSTGNFTFDDIAKMAVAIVKNNDDVRNELKNQFKLIMIDEYQDTSDGQEEFINLIANNNVFCVGDIKQSIYRFRGAKPDLFKKKFDAYKADPSNLNNVYKMNSNYRSRKEILDRINILFSKIMTDDFGGADYKVDHIIKSGNEKFPKEGRTKEHNGFFELHNGAMFSGLCETKYTKLGEVSAAGDASLIALDIKSRVQNQYEIYDVDEDRIRPCTYKDFTVLTFKTKKFPIYQQVFKDFGIPVNVVYKDDIANNFGVVILANIFKLIYLLTLKPEEKDEIIETNIRHLFVSILRSHLYEYKDDEIYTILNNPNGFYNHDLFISLQTLALDTKDMPLKELYMRILKEFPLIETAFKIDGVSSGLDKIELLYQKISAMDSIGYSLKEFCDYFDNLSEYGITIEQSVYSEATDAVTITTCHASKGLEYPLVYLPQLKDFKGVEAMVRNSKFLVTQNLFFLPLFSDPTNTSKFLHDALFDELEEKENRAERLRLFYVALTRAKEDIIFVYDNEAPLDLKTRLDNNVELYKTIHNKTPRGSDINYLESKALKRIQVIDSIDFGKDFESFMVSSNTKLPYSEYADPILNDVSSFFKIAGEEITKEQEEEIIEDLIKKYKEDDFNSSSIQKDPTSIIRKDEFLNTKFDGEVIELNTENIKIYDNVISKLIIKKKHNKTSKKDYDGIELEATFIPKIKRTYDVPSLRRAKEIIYESQKGNYSFLIDIFKLPVPLDRYLKVNDDLIPSSSKFELKSINIEPIARKVKKRASKEVSEEADEGALHFGTHMHALLETIDLKNPNYDFIEDDREKYQVKKVIELLNKLNIKDASIYKEYQFNDVENHVNGFIDLLLVFENKAYIVDYKLKDIDDEAYIDQLSVYKEYISKTFNLINVRTFLLSIVNGVIEEKIV